MALQDIIKPKIRQIGEFEKRLAERAQYDQTPEGQKAIKSIAAARRQNELADINAFDISKEQQAASERNLRGLEDTATRSASAQAGQQQLIQQLQDQAAGRGPSLAEAQLKTASSRNLAQQLAAAAATRGGSAAATQRQLMQNQAASGREVAEKSAEARMQESIQARQQLGALLGQEQQLTDQLRQRYIAQGFDIDTAEKKARQAFISGKYGADVQSGIASKQSSDQLMGSLIGAGASALMFMSDKNQKKNIKDASKDVNSFLDALSARQYEYKDESLPGAAEGKRFGILAQDLEKSKMGKTLVKETPNGKMVDVAQGFGAVLAAQSELNKRIKALEKKGK